MGNSSSTVDDEGSQQAAQPVRQPQSEPTPAQNQPRQTSDIISHTNNNNHCSSSISRYNSDYKNGMEEAKREVVKLPHNFEVLLKHSDMPIDKSSPQNLLQQLRAGVFLNGQKMKYWVRGENINCFMVLANGLKITWGEDKRYWTFQNLETSEGNITVAVLRNVCSLDVRGSFHTRNLTPGVKYEAAYWIMLEDSSYGWRLPVNFRLTLPNGSKQEHKEKLNQRPQEEWLRIPIGEFEAPTENPGEIEFCLYEYDGGEWKKRLVVKGITIEPKI